MKELLEVYDLDNNLIGIQERNPFYEEIRKEFKKTGKITKQVKAVRLILMNSSGRIYIQKRSYIKKENPNLYDKTVGGHVMAGHTWYMTVVRECHEELGFPAVVLSEDEFRTALGVTDLSIIGLFRRVDYVTNFISVRKIKGGEFRQPYITSFYIGYYDGAIRFCDGESTGIEVFTLKQFKKRIKDEPDLFTEDIKFMIEKYEKYLIPIKKIGGTVLEYEE